MLGSTRIGAALLALGVLSTTCRGAQKAERSADAAPGTDAVARAAEGADALAPSADATREDAPATSDAAGLAGAATHAVPVEFLPQRSHSIHSHGGEAAHLREARFVVHNGNARTANVSVVRVEYLTGHSCNVLPSTVRSTPKIDGLSVGSAPPAARVAIPPESRTPITVEFAPVDAYYTYCDRFAFRVTFDVDGTPVQSTAETEVSRVDPLPPP